LKFLDPAQPGQIIRAVAEAVIDAFNPRDQFPAFNVRLQQRKRAQPLPFTSEKCVWSNRAVIK